MSGLVRAFFRPWTNLESRRGDNPYCYYRATTLAGRGLRGKIVKVADAPDEPFAVGRFKVRLERADGSIAPRSMGLDDKRRKRGRLILCPSLQRAVQMSIDEMERHGRRILEIAGTPDAETLSPE